MADVAGIGVTLVLILEYFSLPTTGIIKIAKISGLSRPWKWTVHCTHNLTSSGQHLTISSKITEIITYPDCSVGGAHPGFVSLIPARVISVFITAMELFSLPL